MMDLTVLVMLIVHFDENLKIWGDFGPAGRFLGVDLVETIDKGLILCLETTTNR